MSVFLLCSHSDISSARWSPVFQGSSFSLDIVSDRYKPFLKPYTQPQWHRRDDSCGCVRFRLAMMGSSFSI